MIGASFVATSTCETMKSFARSMPFGTQSISSLRVMSASSDCPISFAARAFSSTAMTESRRVSKRFQALASSAEMVALSFGISVRCTDASFSPGMAS
jgi:hypothetical protein